MELRTEIEPKLDTAEQLYPEILKQILAYTAFVDNGGDEDSAEYTKLEQRLQKLTNKDITKYNLWEYWEEEGAEVLAFRIALPDPEKIDNITKDEVSEIVRRIRHSENWEKDWDEMTFTEQFSIYLDQYYYEFLKLNFTTYNYQKIFGPQKDKHKNAFWLTDEEIVERLWKATI